MGTPEVEWLHTLFSRLASGDTRGFLDGCSPEMTLTARGVAESSVIVRRTGVAAWYEALGALTGGTLRTEVESVVVDGGRAVVVLLHAFHHDGAPRAYRTVNFCTVRDGRLLAWFCHPASRAGYAEAWGLPVPEGEPGRATVPVHR
jgi:ketosteroid isomerase-like protein